METIIRNGEKYAKVKDILEMIGGVCANAGEEPQKGPFDRVDEDDHYYYINCAGRLVETRDFFSQMDEDSYECANYCTDPELLEQRALHETLNRLLWRYSEQHGGDRAWGPIEMDHYSIYRDTLNDRWMILVSATTKYPGVVYFRDERTAQAAIKEIVEPFMEAHPEFEQTKIPQA